MILACQDLRMSSDDDWRKHLIEGDDAIGRLIESTHRIAVLGIKVDPDQPAHFVPEFAQSAGFDIVPVPVYYPEVTEILGKPYRTVLLAIDGDIDMVNVFRRSLATSCRTSLTFWRRSRSQSGCSSEFKTTPQLSNSRVPGSMSFRTAASWLRCATTANDRCSNARPLARPRFASNVQRRVVSIPAIGA